jgi:hypothetical protein
MEDLLSLFDFSGEWSEPFAANGWNVMQWDIKLSEFMDINLIDSAETALELFENVNGIIAAPPCTHFTKSGAQYWSIKDEDGRTWEMVQLVNQVMKLVDLFRPTDPDYDGTFFWAAENPVGRIQKLVPELEEIPGQKGYFFHPYEFAGHLNLSTEDLARLEVIRLKNGIGVTKAESDFITQCNAYKKQTGLWGEFNRDLKKKPIEPVRACLQGGPTQKTGNKSAKTKEERSNTPAGFAQAFYDANKNFRISNIY